MTIKIRLMPILAMVFVLCIIFFAGCSESNNVHRPIVLLTDFGSSDYRTSQLKGIVYSNCPQAELIDATHDIPVFDIPTGAFILDMAAKEFPQGTVFIAVVNPYSQPDERYLVLTTENQQTFVLPDNGLLTYVARDLGIQTIYEISNQELFDDSIDNLSAERIQGTIGALIASGYKPQSVGNSVEQAVMLDVNSPAIEGNTLSGAVIYVDNYGNCVTNITGGNVADFGLERDQNITFSSGDISFNMKFGTIYSDVAQGEAVLFVNNNLGMLQISINLGDFANTHDITAGTNIEISK